MHDSPEFPDLRDALRKKAAVGGGSMDIGSGTHRRRASSGRGFFGFFSSSSATNNRSSKGTAPGGNAAIPGAREDDGDGALPTLETQPSMLAVDLALAAGETRSCTCPFTCQRKL